MEINKLELELQVSKIPKFYLYKIFLSTSMVRIRVIIKPSRRILLVKMFSIVCQEVRSSHRRIMSESVLKLKAMSNELGTCIEKARPYYESRRKAKEVGRQATTVCHYHMFMSLFNLALLGVTSYHCCIS